MIETRLKALEGAIVRLTIRMDELTKALSVAQRDKIQIVVPGEGTSQRHKRKPVTRTRLQEKAEQYIRIFGEEAFDIVLQQWGYRSLPDVEKDQLEPIYNHILRELHEARPT